MSIKNDWHRRIILMVMGLSMGIGYFAYEKIVLREQSRDQSSFTSRIDLGQNEGKWRSLLRTPASAEMQLSKANSFYKVDIQSESKESDEYIELKGVILPTQDINSAKVTWILFKGFEVVKGSLTQDLYNLKSQEPVEVTITLRKTTQEESVVHLSVDSVDGDTALTGMSSFSTELDLGDGAIQKEMKVQKNELLKSEGLDKKILQ